MPGKQWYFENAHGAAEGPLELSELLEKVESHEVDRNTLVWVDPSMKRPFSEIEKLAAQNIDYPNPTPREGIRMNTDTERNEASVRPHPWRRFFARMLDYAIYAVVLGVIFGFWGIFIPPFYAGLIGIALIFFWTFIEAIFLSTLGTTPGKALLSMNVRYKRGKKLSYLDAINRSFSVWWLGLGAAIYPITFITMIVACTKLSNLGETTWDKTGGYMVNYRKLSPWKVAIVVLFFIACIFMYTYRG